MTNLNKAMLIGRLGRDPELRYTKSGQAVANFSIATNDTWNDKQGNRQEKTEWHNVVAWGKQAEFVGNYLKKGRLVYVEGRLQTNDWTDNQNVKHYRTEVVANNIQGLDRTEGGAPGGGGGGAPQEYSQPPQGGPPPQEPTGSSQDEPYLEDDIPF